MYTKHIKIDIKWSGWTRWTAHQHRTGLLRCTLNTVKLIRGRQSGHGGLSSVSLNRPTQILKFYSQKCSFYHVICHMQNNVESDLSGHGRQSTEPENIYPDIT